MSVLVAILVVLMAPGTFPVNVAHPWILGGQQDPWLLPGVLDSPGASLCISVHPVDRIPCSPHPVSQAECSRMGCCFSSRDQLTPCYYGHTVTVRCTPEGHFSIAVSRSTVLPPLHLDSVHLLSSREGLCAPVSRNKAFVIFNFPLSACGTTFKDAGGQRIYENELLADRHVLLSSSASITRSSEFRLTVRCSYSAEDPLPVSILVATAPPPAAVAQQGTLTLEMRIARDQAFASYYADQEYPVVKLQWDPLPLEVRILGWRDPALVLLLHDCWAVPSNNPLWMPQWPLLVNGCPYQGDRYRTQLVPTEQDVGLLYRRFLVRPFTFMDVTSQRMLTAPVFFHCSASACLPSAQERCSIPCGANQQGRRQGGAQEAPRPKLMLASSGPVDFSQVAEASISEGSKALPSDGFLQWEDGLSLAAGMAAMLTVGLLVLAALRRRWGGEEGQV